LRFGAKHLAFLVGGGGGAIVVVGGFFARVLCRHCLPFVLRPFVFRSFVRLQIQSNLCPKI